VIGAASFWWERMHEAAVARKRLEIELLWAIVAPPGQPQPAQNQLAKPIHMKNVPSFSSATITLRSSSLTFMMSSLSVLKYITLDVIVLPMTYDSSHLTDECVAVSRAVS